MQTVSEIYDRLAGWATPSRTKAAAALLVISTFVPGQQPAHGHQARFVSQTNVAAYPVSSQLGLPSSSPYDPTKDVRRARQAQVFADRNVSVYGSSVQVAPFGTQPYDATKDRRGPQSLFFGSAEHFQQPQKGAPLVLNGTAAPQWDVLLGLDTHGWPDPETPWTQGQKNSGIVVLTTSAAYSWQTDVRRARQATHVSEPEAFVSPQRLATVILNGSSVSDILGGHDTIGWPETQQLWQPAQQGSTVVVLTAYVPYSWQTDVQRAGQARQFIEPESFAQVQKPAPLILNGRAAYLFALDVERAKQAQVFGEPETFLQPQTGKRYVLEGTIAGWNALRQPQTRWFGSAEEFNQPQRTAPLILNGTVYNPAVELRRPQTKWIAESESFIQPQAGTAIVRNATSDVARALQAKVFGQPEVFLGGQKPALLVINGSAAPVVIQIPAERIAISVDRVRIAIVADLSSI